MKPKAKPVEITSKVKFGKPRIIHGWEVLPLHTCVCKGVLWEADKEDFEIPIGDNGLFSICPICGRKLYFTYDIHIYAIE